MLDYDELETYLARVDPNEVEAWLDREEVDPDLLTGDELKDAIAAMETWFGPSPYESSATAARILDLHCREDVIASFSLVRDLINNGFASPWLAVSWRRHLFAEQTNRTYVARNEAGAFRWTEQAAPRLRQILARVWVDLVPSLGSNVAAAVFVGPRTTRIVLGQDAIFDDLEAEFLVWHLYGHAVEDLPTAGFGCWIEYRRDASSSRLDPVLGDPVLREREVAANDFAVGRMYDEYGSGPSVPEEGGILRERIVGSRLRHVAQIYDLAAARWESAGRLLRLSPRFNRSPALVRRRWWSPVYLTWVDEDFQNCCRWIPSRRIVYKLGVRLDDIETRNDLDVSAYRYEGLLIDPAEVRMVREVLRVAVATPLRLWHPGKGAESHTQPLCLAQDRRTLHLALATDSHEGG
jgi:hypothetical protein